mgnify:CR=1 FL=1
MVAMIAVSLGVNSIAYGIGLDKTKNNMYDSLREKETSNNNIYITNNSINTNSIKYKKVSNYVTNLLDQRAKSLCLSLVNASILRPVGT